MRSCVQLGSDSAQGSQPLVYLGNSFLYLPLASRRPAPQDRPQRQQEPKPLLSREGDQRLGSFLSCLFLLAKLYRVWQQ